MTFLINPFGFGAAPDINPDPITIAPFSDTVPGLSGTVPRAFTVTGINQTITLSLTRSGQTQSGNAIVNRIDIYVKPAGGSSSFVGSLGPVPGAITTWSVANGSEVNLTWEFQSSSGPAETFFGLILGNVSASTTLASTTFQMSLTG